MQNCIYSGHFNIQLAFTAHKFIIHFDHIRSEENKLNRYFSRLKIVLHCHVRDFIADYAVWALLIVEGRTVTYSCYFLCHLVSCGELSHWQSYHIFFFIRISIIGKLKETWYKMVS